MTKMQQNASQGSQLIILSLGKHYTEGRIRSPHEMHSLIYWEATSGGGPCWAMQNTCSIQNTSQEGLQIRILLANSEE